MKDLRIGLVGRKPANSGEDVSAISRTILAVAGVAISRGVLIVEHGTYKTYSSAFESEFLAAARKDRLLVTSWEGFHKPENDIDLVIVVGGDGTMLEAARTLHGIPMLGINQGRLGFITDIPRQGAGQAVDVILRAWSLWKVQDDSTTPDNVTFESRTLIEAKDHTGMQLGVALNEAAIRAVGGRIIEFNVSVDGRFAYKVRADGLIIATPTGSTAYAYSAGGSILSPGSKALQIIPMMPQTRSYSPLIVSDKECVTVEMLSGEARVYMDGIDSGTIAKDFRDKIKRSTNRIDVCHAQKQAVFVHPHLSDLDYDYYKTLREKLNWHLEPGTR